MLGWTVYVMRPEHLPTRPVHWVIQENQGDDHAVREMVQTLAADGHVPHLLYLSKGVGIPPIPDLPHDAPLVCHGPAFVTRVVNYPRLRPGVFFNPETFRWSAFNAGWKGAMLSSDGLVMPLSAAREYLRGRAAAFVRPDLDSKVFEGGVYDVSAVALLAEQSGVDDSIPVVVASSITIEAEWRFFVVASEIVDCSEYRRFGRPSTQGSVPHMAIELAQELALRWSPQDVYCIDLATTGNRIGVVEANCFNASRFYGASPSRVLRAVNEYILTRTPSDKSKFSS